MMKLTTACSASAALVLILLSNSARNVRALGSDEGKPDEAALKEQREARLSAMRAQVETVVVRRQMDDDWTAVELSPEPLFRYADVPRGILDASLWCWGAKGRPVALTKLEMVKASANVAAQWQYCAASLAERPVWIAWPTRPRFVSSKAGLELHTILESPQPGDKPATRLRQMKDLVKRFSATIFIDGKEALKQEMRQLASPIHRYADDATGLVDGAIFGFSTNGTNPDVLLLIEARSAKEAPPQWQYGIVGMTYAEAHVRLDRTEVFEVPFPPQFDTWALWHVPRNE